MIDAKSFKPLIALPLLIAAAAAASASEPIAEQKAIVDEMARRVVMSRFVYDDAGNVTKLAISNHPAFRKDSDKGKPMPPGVDDELFRQVLKLPRLDAIFIEKQPLSDRSYALLGQLKHLKDVRLHYVRDRKLYPDVEATPDFPLCINELPGLAVLEIKHNFGIKGGCMPKLKPQPELLKLELDTGYAQADAVPFIKAATKLKNLQIHRTTMSDADLQDMLSALPDLEVFELKVSGGGEDRITGRSLRGLANCRKLRLLQLVQNFTELPYEGGLDVLATLPELKQVNIMVKTPKDLSVDTSAVQKLHEARPDILIKVRGTFIGGKPDQQRMGIDDGWDWGGSVTTHG